MYSRALGRRPGWEAPRGLTRRAGPLAVRTSGSGPPVVLLHGLIGSGRFWGHEYDQLAAYHFLVVPDLLGFGNSERPVHGYGPDDHASAVVAALDEVGVDRPALFGAHSLGCVVALRLAAVHPDRVERIVGFGPPLYPDRARARLRIAGASPMAKLFVLPGTAAERACRFVCEHRDAAAVVARWTHPSLPPELADDAVEHSWESYSETMDRCLLTGEPATWLSAIDVPICFVAGAADRVVDSAFLDELSERHPQLRVECWPGDHRLPLAHARRCREHLGPAVTR